MLFDGTDLYTMAHDASVKAQSCIDQSLDLKRKAAEAEARYRELLATKMLDLTTGGMSVSLAKTVAEGDKAVSKAKVDWACAEAVHDANDAEHLLRKKELGLIQDEMGRQWAVAK